MKTTAKTIPAHYDRQRNCDPAHRIAMFAFCMENRIHGDSRLSRVWVSEE